jgi:plasmid maintenance system antidote protein VapI
MSKTPDTDANTWSDSSEGILCKVVSAEFARRLERERDEAREHLDNMQDQRDFAMKVIKRLEQERDEAVEEIKRLKVILDLIKKDVS